MIRFVLTRPTKPPPRRSNADPRRGERAALQLEMSYRLHAAIESGELSDWADAATKLDLTPARISQIAALRFLAPDLQQRLLDGDKNIHERAIRRACTFADWNQQRAAVKDYEVEQAKD